MEKNGEAVPVHAAYLYLLCFLPLALLLLQQRRVWQQLLVLRVVRGGKNAMTNEMLSAYIGQECIIYLMSGQVTGVIESVQDGWLRVKGQQDTDLVNLSYVSRIRRYPRKKNGKKVGVVLD